MTTHFCVALRVCADAFSVTFLCSSGVLCGLLLTESSSDKVKKNVSFMVVGILIQNLHISLYKLS